MNNKIFEIFSAIDAAAPGNPYKELRYLVVEDQAPSRQTLRMCLQAMGGFSVDMAQSHGEAMSRIKLRMPDVIICDYILGNGRTGQQLLEELRRSEQLPERAIFIMVTAERSYEKVISAVELVPDDYIIKPFAPELLRLRLEKVIQKKLAFGRYYGMKEEHKWTPAIEELDAMLTRPKNTIYRFEILRNRAETYGRAGDTTRAIAAYEAIIAEHPFPWARAGLARMLNNNQRYDEARTLVEEVIEEVPTYFEAYDLKSEICTHQGDFEEAQAILAEASVMTPRNWVRKKNLSIAAGRNGDFDTAFGVMQDVTENDIFGDHSTAFLDLARAAMTAGQDDVARNLINSAGKSSADKMSEETRISLECMAAVSEGGEAGLERFDRIRSLIARQPQFTVNIAIDIVRASLFFGDRQLANMTSEKILMGPDARQALLELLAIYRKHELEQPFRDLQREIVSRKLMNKHAAQS